MVYRTANKAQKYDDSYNSNQQWNLIHKTKGQRNSQNRRAYRRTIEGIDDIPSEGSIRRQIYDAREAAMAENYVHSDPYSDKVLTVLAGVAMVGAGTGAGYVAMKMIDKYLDDHNFDLNPLGDVAAEPIQKEYKTRATAEPEYKPVKISDDGENAKKPFAINEKMVGYYSNTDGAVVTKNVDGSSKEKISDSNYADSDSVYLAHDDSAESKIKAVKLDTNEKITVANEGNTGIRNIATSNGKVGFQVYDPYVGNGEHRIYEADVLTKESKLIVKNATLNDVFCDGSYDRVIYTKYTDQGKGVLYVYDAKTDMATRLNPDSEMDEGLCKTYNDYAVFVGDSNVYLKNLKTGDLIDLGAGMHPDINKNFATWDSNGDIYIYDITTEKTTQLKLEKIQDFPSVMDGDKTDYVMFTQVETGFDDPSVWLVDLNPVAEANNAPNLEQILSQSVANGAGWSGKIVASDPDGDNLTTAVQGDAFQLVGDMIQLKDSYTALPGTYMCKATTTDEHGAAKNMFFNITVNEKDVIPNTPPSVRNLEDITIPYGDSSKASGTLEVFDPEGDDVSLSLFNGSSAYFNLIGDKWSLKPEYVTQPGTYLLEVRASDGKDTKDTSVAVTVADKDNNTKPDKPFWKSTPAIVCGSGIGVGGILGLSGLIALIARKKKKTNA